MQIRGVDTKTTKINKKRAERKESIESRYKKKLQKLEDEEEEKISPIQTSTSDEDSTDVYQMPSTSASSSLRLEYFSRACDRRGVGDRTAAALASAILHDIKAESPLVIDRSKVRRERQKTRSILRKKFNKITHELQALYYDGRKDETMYAERSSNGKLHIQIKIEHITLVQEPNSRYFGHVTPNSSGAEDTVESMLDYFTKENTDLSHLVCLGCDGCQTNVGKNTGIICRLEEKLQRPLQWIICQLHSNELPLRHLISELDGKTSGPCGYCGPVGKALETAHLFRPVSYKPIYGPLNDIVADINVNILSTDQKYLLEISQAIISGECSEQIANRSPGKLSHSRWLTTANRIIRLYIGTNSPSSTLISIVTFIIKVYSPGWFVIKCNPEITNGVKNLWRCLTLLKDVKDNLTRKIAQKVMQNNGYFAHPESILISMMCDDRSHIRQLAAQIIMKVRENPSDDIRKFEIPEINFEASDYVNLINWDSITITEPPITMCFPDNVLLSIAEGEEDSAALLCNNSLCIPAHNQAVERLAKETTTASNKVCGHEARDGFIRATLLGREKMPSFETKNTTAYNTLESVLIIALQLKLKCSQGRVNGQSPGETLCAATSS